MTTGGDRAPWGEFPLVEWDDVNGNGGKMT